MDLYDWADYFESLEELRDPKVERAIKNDPYLSLLYAYYVVKGPFPAGEKAIMSNPSTAHYYKRLIGE